MALRLLFSLKTNGGKPNRKRLLRLGLCVCLMWLCGEPNSWPCTNTIANNTSPSLASHSSWCGVKWSAWLLLLLLLGNALLHWERANYKGNAACGRGSRIGIGIGNWNRRPTGTGVRKREQNKKWVYNLVRLSVTHATPLNWYARHGQTPANIHRQGEGNGSGSTDSAGCAACGKSSKRLHGGFLPFIAAFQRNVPTSLPGEQKRPQPSAGWWCSLCQKVNEIENSKNGGKKKT